MSQSTVLKVGLALFAVALAISSVFAGRPSTDGPQWGRTVPGLERLLAEAKADTQIPFVPFEVLAGYECDPSPELSRQPHYAPEIPDNVKRLDRKKLSVLGFMIPVETTGQGVTLFMLLKNQNTCCYGIPPRPNDLIMVESPAGTRLPLRPDVPMLVSGRLEVGAQFNADRDLLCLYKMKADSVRLP